MSPSIAFLEESLNPESLNPMNHQLTRMAMRMCGVLWAAGLVASVPLTPSVAQQIEYEDRIGSNKDFDMCEDFRFRRITGLVRDGEISQQQGYRIWKRIQSDKPAVARVMDQAVAAGELTRDQADRLLPLIDQEMTWVDRRHGRFGQPKQLAEGQFAAGEVSPQNRAAVYQRLIAANERGEMYDYDVASIMNQLYAGFDPEQAAVEEVAIYRGALNPRIGQSGSQERVLQNARMQRERSGRQGYKSSEIRITDPEQWTRQQEKTIYSGPQPGENIPSLTTVNLRGQAAGQELDPVELAGDKPHLMFFVSKSRTFGRFLGQLGKQLQAIEKNSNQPWAISVIVCTDDANEAEKSFAVLDQRYPENVLVSLSKDGSAGPPAYGLDKNLTATVIVAKDGKVVHNFTHAGDAFYTQPHILGAIARVMEVDHDTLRQYIAGTPGDAVTESDGRGMQGNDSAAPPQQGLRTKLAPLVLGERITRGEAAEIFRASGDPEALRKKVGEFRKAGKLTADEARALLSSDQEEASPGPGDR